MLVWISDHFLRKLLMVELLNQRQFSWLWLYIYNKTALKMLLNKSFYSHIRVVTSAILSLVPHTRIYVFTFLLWDDLFLHLWQKTIFVDQVYDFVWWLWWLWWLCLTALKKSFIYLYTGNLLVVWFTLATYQLWSAFLEWAKWSWSSY